MNTELNSELKSVITTARYAFMLTSGATDFQLQIAAYYAAATWHTNKFDRFPFLALYGDTGVGKTTLMDAMEPICFNPVRISMGSETSATIRQKFGKASPGTVLVEEMEQAKMTEVVSGYLVGRYALSSAHAAKMAPTGERGWQEEEYITFGATVMHCRDHFQDPAIENRCIWLNMQLNAVRPKKSYYPVDRETMDSIAQVFEDTSNIDLPEMEYPKDIIGRVADTYEPVMRLAQAVGDQSFIEEVVKQMRVANIAFRDGQAYSPKALVLKALIGCLAVDDSSGAHLHIRSVAVEKELCKFMQNNYNQGMSSRNACQNLKEMGFTLRPSGGINKVMDITVPQLANACLQLGVVDELVANESKR